MPDTRIPGVKGDCVGRPVPTFFQIFAADLPLTLMPGASREDVVASIKGHVMAAAVLTATYKREEEDEWDEDEEFE